MNVQNVTVVGAGNMGSGIAQAFASAGFHVTLNDIDLAAIQRGLDRIKGPLQKRVEAGKMPNADLDALLGALHAESDLAKAVAKADLVVEAVFEDLKVKQNLFARLDKLAPAAAVLATNTSSFKVRELAAATKRPQQVVGLHFFFPAAINKLVEVVKGPATSQAAFDATYAASKKAGKTPIETSDSPGFAVNRFFVPWVNEACRILEEGQADVPTIEAAARQAFGITMGPFELMNVTGVPISYHAQSTLHRDLGAFYEPSKALQAQVDRKANWDLAGSPDPTKAEAVASRLRGVVFGISCHLVEEGVCTIRDTDRGATIGLRWGKGPFAMMDAVGLAKADAEVKALSGRWGKAFPHPKSLAEHAKAGTTWPQPSVRLESLDGDAIARITFDRPEALNALAPRVLQDLDGVLARLEKGPKPRAIIVTGEGKAFIAGADIPTMRAMSVPEARAYTELGHRVIDRLARLPCPVLVAINGFAFGGGLELALAGDLLYASDKAQLGLPEVGLGIHPGFGGTQRLPRRVGIGAAKDLVFTGRTVAAAEALAVGLVDAVFAAADLQDKVLQVARTIAAKAPLAVAGAKSSLDQGIGMDLGSGLQVEQESVVLLFATKDKKEGLDAFVEKRAPRFTGK
ncbi:MAG TPA: enoyl-CoA hydratase-related protein [Candidatus Thermoplasmatota archaeon]|nr:enoyl-CoA hydratase-related protein [Candidatus Thermoplasmatota archaeon]